MINPGLFDVQYELAETLARLKRYEEAAEAYKRAIALSPSTAEIGLALGRVSLELGRLDDAEANARFALGLNAPEAHELLARVALALGDLEMAKQEANLARGNPTVEANAAVLLAEVHLRGNEIQQAILVLDSAAARLVERKLGPVGNLHFLRGDAFARLGRYPEAEAAFKEEIRFFPTNSHAYARLAIVYALERRTVREVYGILEAMHRAHPTRETSLSPRRLSPPSVIGAARGSGADAPAFGQSRQVWTDPFGRLTTMRAVAKSPRKLRTGLLHVHHSRARLERTARSAAFKGIERKEDFVVLNAGGSMPARAESPRRRQRRADVTGTPGLTRRDKGGVTRPFPFEPLSIRPGEDSFKPLNILTPR